MYGTGFWTSLTPLGVVENLSSVQVHINNHRSKAFDTLGREWASTLVNKDSLTF